MQGFLMCINKEEKFKLAIEEKNIKRLLHFTNCKNLNTISKFGLLSRERLDAEQIDYEYNDSSRYDGCTNTISVSISFPNYAMFYKLMKDYPSTDWAIIVIHPRVIYKQKCAFCVDNAASSEETRRDVNSKMGFETFERCFDDYSSTHTRQSLKIPDCYTTNPQSEILVFDKIGLDDIIEVAFRYRSDLEKYEDSIGALKGIVKSDIFSYRSDFGYWGKYNNG